MEAEACVHGEDAGAKDGGASDPRGQKTADITKRGSASGRQRPMTWLGQPPWRCGCWVSPPGALRVGLWPGAANACDLATGRWMQGAWLPLRGDLPGRDDRHHSDSRGSNCGPGHSGGGPERGHRLRGGATSWTGSRVSSWSLDESRPAAAGKSLPRPARLLPASGPQPNLHTRLRATPRVIHSAHFRVRGISTARSRKLLLARLWTCCSSGHCTRLGHARRQRGQ